MPKELEAILMILLYFFNVNLIYLNVLRSVKVKKYSQTVFFSTILYILTRIGFDYFQKDVDLLFSHWDRFVQVVIHPLIAHIDDAHIDDETIYLLPWLPIFSVGWYFNVWMRRKNIDQQKNPLGLSEGNIRTCEDLNILISTIEKLSFSIMRRLSLVSNTQLLITALAQLATLSLKLDITDKKSRLFSIANRLRFAISQSKDDQIVIVDYLFLALLDYLYNGKEDGLYSCLQNLNKLSGISVAELYFSLIKMTVDSENKLFAHRLINLYFQVRSVKDLLGGSDNDLFMLVNIISLYKQLKDYPEAHTLATQLLESIEGKTDTSYVAFNLLVHANLFVINLNLENLDEAQEHLESYIRCQMTLQELEMSDGRVKILSRDAMGILRSVIGEYFGLINLLDDEASLKKRFIKSMREIGMPVHLLERPDPVVVEKIKGMFPQVARITQQKIESYRKEKNWYAVSYYLLDLGKSYMNIENDDSAIETGMRYMQQALDIGIQWKLPSRIIFANYILAVTHKGLAESGSIYEEHMRKSLQYSWAAITEFEINWKSFLEPSESSPRKIGFFSEFVFVYHFHVDLLLRRGSCLEALWQFERSKSININEFQRLKHPTPEDEVWKLEMRDAFDKLKQSHRSESRYPWIELYMRLVAKAAKMDILGQNFSKETLIRKIEPYLRDSAQPTAFLVFFLNQYSDLSHIFVLTHFSMDCGFSEEFPLGGNMYINIFDIDRQERPQTRDLSAYERIKRVYYHWSNKYDAFKRLPDTSKKNHEKEWNGQLSKYLDQLSEIIGMDDLATQLREKVKNLVLVPHDLLNPFPLHALPTGKGGSERLIDLFDISYLPNLTVPFSAFRKESESETLEPRGNCWRFLGVQASSPLREEEDNFNREREAVQGVLGGKLDCEWLTEPAMLKSGCLFKRAATCHYLHFSCHGVFNQREPLLSYLELIEETEPAAVGRVYALELLLGLSLSACRLVYLSACESGLTQTAPVDENINLAGAFLQSGAQYIIATKWITSHESCCCFAENFYAGFEAGNEDVITWFSQCLRTFKGKEEHLPLSRWAPFHVIGLPARRGPPIIESCLID